MPGNMVDPPERTILKKSSWDKWNGQPLMASKIIAVDKKGQIVVADTDNHRVQIFSSDGEFISKFGSKGTSDGCLSCPRGLALDSQGDIIVCSNHRFQVWDPIGHYSDPS
jgi:DNA-binding beta-propeller fold protein YncE